MTKIFLTIILLLNGSPVQIKELIGPDSATMKDCVEVAARYQAKKLPEGYSIRASCEERQVGTDV